MEQIPRSIERISTYDADSIVLTTIRTCNSNTKLTYYIPNFKLYVTIINALNVRLYAT